MVIAREKVEILLWEKRLIISLNFMIIFRDIKSSPKKCLQVEGIN